MPGIMFTQNQILRTLSAPESQALLELAVAQSQAESRNALARDVCERFGLTNARGGLQVAGCVKALNKLERQGRIVLPPPRPAPSMTPAPSLLDGPVPPPADVPGRVDQVEGLRLVPVDSAERRRVINTLLHHEHPQGAKTFFGCQMRYLVESDHGLLGAVCFSSAALHMKDRDRWMGWSRRQRGKHLHRALCLNRFLVRPPARCQNLASRVLGMALRRLADDFEARHGYRPWVVETCVAPGWDGACFRAANFERIGRTSGRGRGAQAGRNCGAKTLYAYTLEPRWRALMGEERAEPVSPLRPGDGLGGGEWAEHEFGGAPLGDKRLEARLVKSAELLGLHPGQGIGAAGDRAAAKGWFRLIEQPDESQVTPEAILQPHRGRTVQRMAGQDTVLAAIDRTDFRFATRPGCEDLVVIGRNQTSAEVLGMRMQSTLALTAGGLPLGLLRCGFDGPREEENETAAGGSAPRTERWLDAVRDLGEAASRLPDGTRVVAVMDREADCFGILDACRQTGRVDSLVRVRHDRNLGVAGSRLSAALASAPVAGAVEVDLERVTARPKSSRKKARPGREARIARLEIRHCAVDLPSTVEGLEPIRMHAVQAREASPPDGAKPVVWTLLTSLKVDGFEAAAEAVRFYRMRWRVEDFFRVLKSGCGAERLRFQSAERLQRAIAVQAVIAWRLMAMVQLGREVPDCAPETVYSDVELRFLADYAATRRLPPPETLRAAMILVAVLGGYSNRKGDPPPGYQIMWRGYDCLSMAVIGYRVFEDMHGAAESGEAETNPRGSPKRSRRGGSGGKASGKTGGRDHA